MENDKALTEIIRSLDKDIKSQTEIYRNKPMFFLYSRIKKQKIAYLAELKRLDKQLSKIQKSKSMDVLDSLIEDQINSVLRKINSLDQELDFSESYSEYFRKAEQILKKY